LKTFDCGINSTKVIWRAINNLISLNPEKCKANINTISKILINGNISSDPLQIASHFHTYFCNIGAELAAKISPPTDNSSFKNFLGSPITNSFVCDEISYTEIHEKSFKQKHKSSKGPDAISSKFIFELEEVFLEPIFLIFNLSLRSGVFPDHLKIAKILPLFKKLINY